MAEPPQDRGSSRSDPPTERIRVDLTRLPGWLQLVIAALIAVAVGALALASSHRDPGAGSLLVGIAVGVVALAVVALCVARRR